MAFDAGMVMAVGNELRAKLLGARVDKIQQPEKDEIILLMHANRENTRLLLSFSAASPRINITESVKENPLTAPMFCMLLRKHISGARLADIIQPGFERVLELVFDTTDDMGYPVKRSLIIEIMGKYSNIIFCDENKKILGAGKPVDFTTSQKRQVLTGMTYELPPPQDKENPLNLDKQSFIRKCSEYGAAESENTDKFITKNYLGISTLLAREIVYRAGNDPERLFGILSRIISDLKSGISTPTLIRDESGNPSEYCFTDITFLGAGAAKSHPETVSALIEQYYCERDRNDRRRQREADLLHLLTNTENRLRRKLSAQMDELKSCEDGALYKRYGDIITENMWVIKRGDESAKLTDYSTEKLEEVEIPLDKKLTPSQNAQKYFKRYNKLKTAEQELTKQIAIASSEINYIETVFDALSRCESEADIDEIRDELSQTGFSSKLKGSNKKQKKKPDKARAIEYKTTGGFRVLCGRNNLQNDILTTRVADRNDWWFHVKNIPGSHVILFSENEREPEARDFTEAAVIAACNSKAQDGDNVAVDYTMIRYVKKPSSSKPGFVTYTKNWTAYVTLDKESADRLRIGK